MATKTKERKQRPQVGPAAVAEGGPHEPAPVAEPRARARAPKAGKPEPRAAVAERFQWTEQDGNAIRAAREAAGLTKGQLAALAGVSGARIYEVETAFPGRGPNKALKARLIDGLMGWTGGQVYRTAHAADCPVSLRHNDPRAVCACEPTQVPVGKPTPPVGRGPKRKDSMGGGKRPHLVAEVALAERPVEGHCPSEEEMAEEERLAAEAGHPVEPAPGDPGRCMPVEPDKVTAAILTDDDEADLTA